MPVLTAVFLTPAQRLLVAAGLRQLAFAVEQEEFISNTAQMLLVGQKDVTPENLKALSKQILES